MSKHKYLGQEAPEHELLENLPWKNNTVEYCYIMEIENDKNFASLTRSADVT